eukprot:scaffold229164_cov27-Tisochrysis_lutea.AAC.6
MKIVHRDTARRRHAHPRAASKVPPPLRHAAGAGRRRQARLPRPKRLDAQSHSASRRARGRTMACEQCQTR